MYRMYGSRAMLSLMLATIKAEKYLTFFFAPFTTRLLRYVLRIVLAYVQNAPGILVRPLRLNTFFFVAAVAWS